MANDPQHIDSYQRALDTLLSEAPIDGDDQIQISLATSALMRVIRRRQVVPAATVNTSSEKPEKPLGEPTGRSNYDGLSVAEATVEYLQTLPAKEDKRATEIVEHLRSNGFEIAAENADGSLSTALRRRANNYRDVVQVARGRWGLRDWYTQKEITEFSHRERTIAGMEAAKARGVKMGKGWAISPAEAADIKRRLDAGEKQTAIARDYGCAANTIHRYKKLLKDWNPGDPFPPEPDAADPSGKSPKVGEKGDATDNDDNPSLFKVVK